MTTQAATGLHQVVDADTSQTLAVIDAIDGRNLVIQGPPGTGKSQTLTNLLGEALARGEKDPLRCGKDGCPGGR